MTTSLGRLRLAQAFLAGIVLLVLVLHSLPPYAYSSDLRQEYLTARALRDGINPLTRLPELSDRYLPLTVTNLPHPSPHPPVLALLGVPVSFVPYELAVPLWLAANAGLLVAVGRWLGLSGHASLALAAWPPMWWALFWGQLEIVLLALAIRGWRAAGAGQLWRAGLWLGLATAIKLYPAALLVPFAARRQFPVLIAAGGVFAISQAATLLMLGPDDFLRYYLVVLPGVIEHNAQLSMNTSAYGAMLLLFGEPSEVEPLIGLPALVLPLSVALSAVGVIALVRLPPQAAPVAFLVASPAAWGSYVLLALPHILTLLRGSAVRWAVLAAAAAASLVPSLVSATNELLMQATGWTGSRAPAMSGLLAIAQFLGYLGLLYLSVRSRPPAPGNE